MKWLLLIAVLLAGPMRGEEAPPLNVREKLRARIVETLPPPRAEDKPEPESPVMRLAPGVAGTEPLLVLPRLEINAPRIGWSETDILTDKGLIDFAKRKYTTPLYNVTIGPLAQLGTYYFNFLAILGGWHPSEAEAMALYQEDRRVRILTEVDSLLRLEALGGEGDQMEHKRIRQQVRQQGIHAMGWNPFAQTH